MILGSFILAYLLWTLYIIVMGLYRIHLAGKLTLATKIMGAPYLVLGYLVDILTNVLVASFVLLELPKELLVTSRLKRHLKTGSGWRYKVSKTVCESLLDPFDPTGSHCD